ncbi:MAG TPA: sigma factor-like helix-turn-helix DNA-binding protein, partial [Salinisphaeraceae bacterium]|nr:sigma factor-like helix-turn-helix DNA-binding protein [Salinisphaeraceae bacterium]
MERRLSSNDAAFDAVASADDEYSYAPEDYLASAQTDDPAYGVETGDWQAYQHSNLNQAMNTLDDRSRDILQSRWLREDGKVGLQALGDKYGVSAERIRQLEAAAIKKLRTTMAPS